MSRSRRGAPALAPVPEDESQETEAAPCVRLHIERLEAQVDERIQSMLSAAEDSIMALKNEAKRLCVLLPKKIRDMPLLEFQAQYPDDFKSGALAEIRSRYAALTAEAAKPPPPTGRTTGTKRGHTTAATTLRTVRPRRGVTDSIARPSQQDFEHEAAEAAASAAVLPPPPVEATASRRSTRTRTAAGVAADSSVAGTSQAATEAGAQAAAGAEPPTGRRAVRRAAAASFNGMPLQTPMPFAGEAVPLPITLLAQKRGGARTAATAAAAPDAAVITTADGMQWAVGKGGTAVIPESHRSEVEGLLSAQFEFIAAALGKTVFSRGRR